METLLLTIVTFALTLMNAAAHDAISRADTLARSTNGLAPVMKPSGDMQVKIDTTNKGKGPVPPKDVVEVDVPPTVVSKVEPVYPEEAIKHKIEGKVWVKIWIDSEGKVRDVVLMKSDAEIFNEPAIEAARKFVFTPAYVNREPVAVWVSVPFKFKLAPFKSSNGGEENTMKQFLSMVRDVIDQKDIAKAKAVLDPKAYMIDGTRFKSILETLRTGRKGNALLAEQTRKITFTKLKIADDGKWAYLVLRTESLKSGNLRYHTILFSRDSAGLWHIEHWHVSK